jgi:hypothetical protein
MWKEFTELNLRYVQFLQKYRRRIIIANLLYTVGIVIGGPAWPITIPKMVAEKLGLYDPNDLGRILNKFPDDEIDTLFDKYEHIIMADKMVEFFVVEDGEGDDNEVQGWVLWENGSKDYVIDIFKEELNNAQYDFIVNELKSCVPGMINSSQVYYAYLGLYDLATTSDAPEQAARNEHSSRN